MTTATLEAETEAPDATPSDVQPPREQAVQASRQERIQLDRRRKLKAICRQLDEELERFGQSGRMSGEFYNSIDVLAATLHSTADVPHWRVDRKFLAAAEEAFFAILTVGRPRGSYSGMGAPSRYIWKDPDTDVDPTVVSAIRRLVDESTCFLRDEDSRLVRDPAPTIEDYEREGLNDVQIASQFAYVWDGNAQIEGTPGANPWIIASGNRTEPNPKSVTAARRGELEAPTYRLREEPATPDDEPVPACCFAYALRLRNQHGNSRGKKFY